MPALAQVLGARSLRKALKAAGDDLAQLKELHARIARHVLASAKIPGRTGRLAASARASGTTSMAIARVGRKKVPYAGVVHWGWPRRNIPKNTFLTTAASRTEGTWVNWYYQKIQDIIEQVEGA